MIKTSRKEGEKEVFVYDSKKKRITLEDVENYTDEELKSSGVPLDNQVVGVSVRMNVADGRRVIDYRHKNQYIHRNSAAVADMVRTYGSNNGGKGSNNGGDLPGYFKKLHAAFFKLMTSKTKISQVLKSIKGVDRKAIRSFFDAALKHIGVDLGELNTLMDEVSDLLEKIMRDGDE